jgi:aspartate carbamoyltransferase catalytic subunit
MVGDIVHSRVARSTTRVFRLLGAEVVWVAPSTLLPPETASFGVRCSEDFDTELAEADICYVLRIQRERINEALFPSIAEYQRRFGFTRQRADRVFGGELLMHPGPMIRGVEIEGDAADDPRSVVTQQVANGVAIRMAVLFSLLGAHTDVDTDSLG